MALRQAPVFLALLVGACASDTAAPPPPSSTPTSVNTNATPEATPKPAREKRTRGPLVRQDPLPALIRQELKTRMTEHGDDMESLMWSALMLDYDSVSAISRFLADAPRLSRPGPAAARGTLNEALPPRFFDLQDELHQAATDLLVAAQKNDDAAIAKHVGRITTTCISCHALYLRMPAQRP